jgi:hypothetical protein
MMSIYCCLFNIESYLLKGPIWFAGFPFPYLALTKNFLGLVVYYSPVVPFEWPSVSAPAYEFDSSEFLLLFVKDAGLDLRLFGLLPPSVLNLNAFICFKIYFRGLGDQREKTAIA